MARNEWHRAPCTARRRVSFHVELFVSSHSSCNLCVSLIRCAVSSYPLALINMFISGGLLFIHLPTHWLPKTLHALQDSYDWRPPFRTWTPVVLFFFVSNIFLVAVPLIPPARGYRVYDHLPYSWLRKVFERPCRRPPHHPLLIVLSLDPTPRAQDYM